MDKPPVWIRNILAPLSPWHRAIELWLEPFAGGEVGLEPLGGGHFGYAYRIWRDTGKPLSDPSEFGGGEQTHLVLKITRDPTEGPFCRWIHEEQEKGNSLFQGAFARMYDVRKLPRTIAWRGKEWPVFLVIREEVRIVQPPITAFHALHALQIAGRQLAHPPKRGIAKVELQVNARGQPVIGAGALMSLYGRRVFPATRIWEEALGHLELDQQFYYVWEAFWQLRNEYDLYLQDVHGNNVGLRTRMPGDDWSGAEDYWVIFDPGHTATGDRAGTIELLRAGNPAVTYEDIHYEGIPWVIMDGRHSPVVGESGWGHGEAAFQREALGSARLTEGERRDIEGTLPTAPYRRQRDDHLGRIYDRHAILTGRWHPVTRTLAFWNPQHEELFWKHIDRLQRGLGIGSLDDVQIAVLGGDPSSSSPIRYMNPVEVPLL